MFKVGYSKTWFLSFFFKNLLLRQHINLKVLWMKTTILNMLLVKYTSNQINDLFSEHISMVLNDDMHPLKEEALIIERRGCKNFSHEEFTKAMRPVLC